MCQQETAVNNDAADSRKYDLSRTQLFPRKTKSKHIHRNLPCWPGNIKYPGWKKGPAGTDFSGIDRFVLLERYPGVGGGDADSRRWAAGE